RSKAQLATDSLGGYGPDPERAWLDLGIGNAVELRQIEPAANLIRVLAPGVVLVGDVVDPADGAARMEGEHHRVDEILHMDEGDRVGAVLAELDVALLHHL